MTYENAGAVFLAALVVFLVYNIAAWTEKYHAALDRMDKTKDR